jgi:hypothetical protein
VVTALAAVGAPEMTPVPVSSASPAGSAGEIEYAVGTSPPSTGVLGATEPQTMYVGAGAK